MRHRTLPALMLLAAAAFWSTNCTLSVPNDGGPGMLDADAGQDQMVNVDDAVTLLASATGGAPPYLFHWSIERMPDEAEVTLPDEVTNPALDLEPLAVEGRYVFRVRVTDSAGASDASFVEVLSGAELAVTASTDQTLRMVGESAALALAYDADTNGLAERTYLWEIVGGEGELDDPSSRTPTLTVTSPETVQLLVTVETERDGIPVMGTSEVFVVGIADSAPQVVISNEGAVSGDIVLELLTEAAPNTCANFLKYVDDRFYDGVIWHRVVNDFVMQGGAFERIDGELQQKEGERPPIASEALNGESNVRGFVALALRGDDADSGSNQFFINLTDNSFLDDGTPPFTVFAQVVDGLDVVDAIAAVPVGDDPFGLSDVPTEDVVMSTVRRRTP